MRSLKIAAVAVIAVTAIVLCSFAITNMPKDNGKGTVGIIGAMEVEVVTIENAMTDKEMKNVAGMPFCVGKLDDQKVVLAQCGMGKVNAAVCAQLLISEFHVKCIINTGVAGSLDNRLNIGDFVVSTEAVQHDFDVTPIHYQKGEIPYTGLVAFKADDTLRQKAVNAIKECAPEIKAMEGRVCSGDQFIATNEQKDTISSYFGGLCCEMEGGAIAQTCYLNDIPFVIIRAISDKADGSEMEDYTEFEKKAAARSAKVVQYMVEEHF